MLVLTLLLSSLPLMAEDVDYKHCASTMNEMLSSMNEFATMDDKGDFKIKPKASSMKNYGNSLGYKSFIMQKNKKKYEALDEETFEVEYESLVDGKPVGKIKKVSYSMKNLKDIENKKPGAVDISFDFKNGQCIPQVTKYDSAAGLNPALKLMYKGMNKMSEYADDGAKDLYKCKELHDYMKEIDDLKACRDIQTKLLKLQQLVNNVDAKLGKKPDEVSKKKIKESISAYTDVVGKAALASLSCSQSGYNEILSDDEYWKKVNAEIVSEDDTAKVQAK